MIHQTLIRRSIDTPKRDGVLIIDENLKILPRLQMHLLPNRTWQNNLTFL